MTDDVHNRWQAYIHECASYLRLLDWDVRLCRDHTPSEGAIASAAIPYGRRQVNVHLSADFFAGTPQDQRSTVVHELIHCHFEDMDERMRLAIDSDDAKQDLMMTYYRRDREVAIDTLAEIIAPYMPLPS